MKQHRRLFITLTVMLIAFLAIGALWLRAAYERSIAAQDEGIQQFLEQQHAQEVVLLKTAEKDYVKAVLFERVEDGDHCIAVFHRSFFGLRLKYKGMDTFGTDGTLGRGGSWSSNGVNGSRCHIEVYGDNRSGAAGAYFMNGVPEVRRDNLEADYILDIYILDGIEELPKAPLKQLRPGVRLPAA